MSHHLPTLIPLLKSNAMAILDASPTPGLYLFNHQHHSSSSPQQPQHAPAFVSQCNLLSHPHISLSDFTHESNSTETNQSLHVCKESACETDHVRLLGSRSVVNLAVGSTLPSIKSSSMLVDDLITSPTSIYDHAQSRKQPQTNPLLPSLLIPPSSQTHSATQPNLCFDYYGTHTLMNGPQNCSLNCAESSKCSRQDHVLLDADILQDKLLLNGSFERYPLATQVEGGMICEACKTVLREKNEKQMAYETFFPWSQSSSEIDWHQGACAIETFDHTSCTNDNSRLIFNVHANMSIISSTPVMPVTTASAVTDATVDVTPDHHANHAASLFDQFKHDDSDSVDLGVLCSSSLLCQPPCCHTCTATSTTTPSPFIDDFVLTPSMSLPPTKPRSDIPLLGSSLPLPSLLSSSTSPMAYLRSPSCTLGQPSHSTTIDVVASSPSSPLFSSPVLLPPTATLMASAFLSSALFSKDNPKEQINMIDPVGSIDVHACSVTISLPPSVAPNSSLFHSFTKIISAQQHLTNTEQSHSIYATNMRHMDQASTPLSSFTSTPPDMLDSSSHSNRCHHDSCQSSQPLNQNGEPIDGADENYHHMDETIKLATGYCHDNLKMDSSSDLSLAYVDRNGNPAILNQQLPCQRPSRSGVSQEQIEHGAAQELSRQEILARISPRATMMSRTLQALPDIPSRNEPIAHQIRRVQSEHLADIQRQWEDQQQRRLQQDQERQLQRDGSYSLESIAISRHAPVTISRFIAVSQPIEPSLRPTSDGLMHMPVVLPHVHEEMHQKNQSQGSNLSYLNYEKDDLQPEECWRRGQDDMVGR